MIESIGNEYIFTGYSQTVEHCSVHSPERYIYQAVVASDERATLPDVSQARRALTLLNHYGCLVPTATRMGEAWTMGEIAYVKYRIGRLGRPSTFRCSDIDSQRRQRASKRAFAIQAMAQREAV